MNKNRKNYSDIHAAGEKKTEEKAGKAAKSSKSAYKTHENEKKQSVSINMKGEETMNNSVSKSLWK